MKEIWLAIVGVVAVVFFAGLFMVSNKKPKAPLPANRAAKVTCVFAYVGLDGKLMTETVAMGTCGGCSTLRDTIEAQMGRPIEVGCLTMREPVVTKRTPKIPDTKREIIPMIEDDLLETL